MTQEDNYTKGLKKLLEMGRENTMLNQDKFPKICTTICGNIIWRDLGNAPIYLARSPIDYTCGKYCAPQDLMELIHITEVPPHWYHT
ncbi:MAG: hypothetical protein CM15mP111_4490 [Hyphomicrobiales bacterium]|nr:MAG: hypothetical protein CM15mP111_4490 [Hyphomicrobiales bacterium]